MAQLIDRWGRGGPEAALARVGDDAESVQPVLGLRIVSKRPAFGEWIAGRPQPAGDRLADDQHREPAGAIGVGERPPTQ